eukprot:GHVU01194123.1.p1 GENE.GHVU01194123.1~~GHVU01194123.1.p1  ORF type:complete len:221 (-),score=10.78 GHVU01194123.1:154-816(-)
MILESSSKWVVAEVGADDVVIGSDRGSPGVDDECESAVSYTDWLVTQVSALKDSRRGRGIERAENSTSGASLRYQSVDATPAPVMLRRRSVGPGYAIEPPTGCIFTTLLSSCMGAEKKSTSLDGLVSSTRAPDGTVTTNSPLERLMRRGHTQTDTLGVQSIDAAAGTEGGRGFRRQRRRYLINAARAAVDRREWYGNGLGVDTPSSAGSIRNEDFMSVID